MRENTQFGTIGVPTQTREVTMYRLRMESSLLLGAAFLAGCSDRNTPTAPSVRPLAATTALVDRPYTWSFTCHSNKTWTIGVYAGWSWLDQNGVPIDGTSQSVVCRSEEHTSELQSRLHLVCRLLLEKKKKNKRKRPG